ncbi:P-loop containing nucleoside triphosphate hydrolase protein [Thermothelomyces heterothallicus CBS 202.75]|uniref:P-loop containing nucleoside triphosphate hydrolase protein n=1 Tax=Thermothelomyces heterothallicus CBS 202.75 TaxID=1149848 RepID=UPI003743F483
MWRTARESVCLICRSATQRTTALPELGQPWMMGQRTFATRGDRPSRMVLSDRVARGSRADDASRRSRDRDRPEGPWGGANRTVANIDPARRRGPASNRRDRKADTRDEPGQTRDKDESHLKALKMQRALATISYRQRTAVKARISDVESFEQFDLLPSLKEAVYNEVLKGMVDVKPTPVQRLAIPALLGKPVGQHADAGRRPKGAEPKREEFLLAAETGSGKTLAYLLPIIQALKIAEADDDAVKAYNERLEAERERRGGAPVSEWIDKFEPHPNHARPRAVVLVPTAELVDQVLATAKKISHVAKFKVRPVSASYSPVKIQRNMYSHGGIDMVVATPHLLAAMAESDPNILSRVHHLVIDEADSLLDRSFSPETTKIVERAMPSLKQLVLCSATIPLRLDNYLADHFPDIKRIATPNLHAIPRRVQLGVVDVSKDPYRNNKLLACADAIWTIGKDSSLQGDADEVDIKRIMVFVNERETTQQVADYLVSKGIDAVALHRDTPEHRQSEMLASFTTREPMRATRDEIEAAKRAVLARAGPAAPRRHLPNTKVIVATDLASRGIDTLAVRHVVLYDVPHTTIDFIHRLGRAGRMGRRGRGIVLVGKNDRRDVVAEVKESMFRGQALI